MKVFVFGGTGFIGRNVVKNLVQHGHTVSALARSQASADALKQLGTVPKLGDLERLDTLHDAVKGAEVIVNAAFPSFLGRMTMARVRKDSLEALNQMKNLLEVVAEVRVPTILTEGTMALGDSGNDWLDESSPYTFDTGHGRLLRLSVPYAQRIAVEKNLPIITLSLSGAYGAGTWFKESIYSYIKKGQGIVVGDGLNVWSFAHVEDIADAYRLAVEQLPIGQIFALADDEPIANIVFSDFVADSLGKPHVKHMPKWLANVLMGSVLCEAMTMNQKVSNAKAKAQLGWKLKYPSYREGVPAALAEIEGVSEAASNPSPLRSQHATG